MRKRIRDRKATQAEYQREYRAQQAALRKPSRDDVAGSAALDHHRSSGAKQRRRARKMELYHRFTFGRARF